MPLRPRVLTPCCAWKLVLSWIRRNLCSQRSMSWILEVCSCCVTPSCRNRCAWLVARAATWFWGWSVHWYWQMDTRPLACLLWILQRLTAFWSWCRWLHLHANCGQKAVRKRSLFVKLCSPKILLNRCLTWGLFTKKICIPQFTPGLGWWIMLPRSCAQIASLCEGLGLRVTAVEGSG